MVPLSNKGGRALRHSSLVGAVKRVPVTVEHLEGSVPDRQHNLKGSPIAGIRKFHVLHARGQVNGLEGGCISRVVKDSIAVIAHDPHLAGSVRAEENGATALVVGVRLHHGLGGRSRGVIAIVVDINNTHVDGVLTPPETIVPIAPAVIITVIPPPTVPVVARPETASSHVPSIPVVSPGVIVVAIIETAIAMPVIMVDLCFPGVVVVNVVDDRCVVIDDGHVVLDDVDVTVMGRDGLGCDRLPLGSVVGKRYD